MKNSGLPSGKMQEKLDRFKGVMLSSAAQSITQYEKQYHINIRYQTEEGRITDINFSQLASINS